MATPNSPQAVRQRLRSSRIQTSFPETESVLFDRPGQRWRQPPASGENVAVKGPMPTMHKPSPVVIHPAINMPLPLPTPTARGLAQCRQPVAVPMPTPRCAVTAPDADPGSPRLSAPSARRGPKIAEYGMPVDVRL
jgi:hypothetical protein